MAFCPASHVRVQIAPPRFDPGLSTEPGGFAPGTLASPRTGLPPAGYRELVARLRHDRSFLLMASGLLDARGSRLSGRDGRCASISHPPTVQASTLDEMGQPSTDERSSGRPRHAAHQIAPSRSPSLAGAASPPRPKWRVLDRARRRLSRSSSPRALTGDANRKQSRWGDPAADTTVTLVKLIDFYSTESRPPGRSSERCDRGAVRLIPVRAQHCASHHVEADPPPTGSGLRCHQEM